MEAEEFMRPFIGTDEFLYGLKRWILYLDGASPAQIRPLPSVRERIAAVARTGSQVGAREREGWQTVPRASTSRSYERVHSLSFQR